MLSSYGESEVMFSSRRVGRVRLKSISSRPALAPRLAWNFGFQLHDVASDSTSDQAIIGYQLTDLSGDISLGKHGPHFASLEWSGRRGRIKSSNYGSERDVRMVSDLDWSTLEGLERLRQGDSLELSVSLWPRIEHEGSVLDADIREFQCQIPRESWLPVLEKLRGDRVELLEIPLPTAVTEQFRGTLAELREARRQIDFGEYATAIVRCRKAAEILASVTRLESEDADSVGEILEPFVGPERAKVYAGILSRVKRLGNVELHDVVDRAYSRSEALFAVRTLELLTYLCGSILNGAASE